MAGKGEGEGEGSLVKLDNQIAVMKYVLLFTNIIIWMAGACIFALCMWMRFEPKLEEWIVSLELSAFYIGVYVLIVASVIMMLVSFVGCLSALQESTVAILVYIGTQIFGFICSLAGSAVLLEFSTRNSQIQPMIRESMRRLIMNSNYVVARETLAMIQENIGCCGADGPNDYLSLQQPLPSQCRDTVTGNPFFYGCVDTLTWFFEEKTGWIVGIAMTVALIHVINVAVATVLIQALNKEEEETDAFRK